MVPIRCEKPWGYEITLGVSNRVAMKIVHVNPNETLSRQFHVRKDEIYYVYNGSGEVELGSLAEVTHELSKGDVLHVAPGTVHRLTAGSAGITIHECSTPEINDVIRTEDKYGRQATPNLDPLLYLAHAN